MADTESLPARLARYLEEFQGTFRRRDQRSWAAVYLRGLLETPGRKNVESLARATDLPANLCVEDVAQALGHFLNQSPWDEEALWRRHQERLAASHSPEEGMFVLEEMAFVKQGRHSVGVQRQLSRVHACKLNCQLAVGLYHLGTRGCFPLALRLYLPRGWLADEARLDLAGVPGAFRKPATRLELGLGLLDAARAAGMGGTTLVAGPGWQGGEDLEAAARERGLVSRDLLPEELAGPFEMARTRLLDDLGLGHFEGRSWRGFHHHACLVMLAAAFLAGVRNHFPHS